MVEQPLESPHCADDNNNKTEGEVGMATADMQTIYVKSDEKPVREGKLHYTQFSSSDRMSKALKVLALCWLGAGITLFIPIAHFVLVPGFLIAGPVMAYLRYKVDRATENVEVQCPACEKDVTIKLDAADRLPIYTYCSDCNQSLQLTEK